MIAVSNLSYRYNAANVLTFPNFAVLRSEPFLLLGESGSGKTTLLHLVGGLLRNYEGSIVIDNTELSTLSESALDKFRGQHVGFIFQKNHLISSLTVEKNIALSAYLAGLPVDNVRLEQVLATLGLWEKRHSHINALSQGQAQRVAIARAMLNHPSIIFADEPTAALDDKNCDRVIRLLLDAAQSQQAALIVATHDQRVKAAITNMIQLQPSHQPV